MLQREGGEHAGAGGGAEAAAARRGAAAGQVAAHAQGVAAARALAQDDRARAQGHTAGRAPPRLFFYARQECASLKENGRGCRRGP